VEIGDACTSWLTFPSNNYALSPLNLSIRYKLLDRLGWVIHQSNIRQAQRSLFFISNAMFDVHHAIANYEHARTIEEALGVITEFQIEQPDTPAAEEPEDNDE
jgi:hypothetical protein